MIKKSKPNTRQPSNALLTDSFITKSANKLKKLNELKDGSMNRTQLRTQAFNESWDDDDMPYSHNKRESLKVFKERLYKLQRNKEKL